MQTKQKIIVLVSTYANPQDYSSSYFLEQAVQDVLALREIASKYNYSYAQIFVDRSSQIKEERLSSKDIIIQLTEQITQTNDDIHLFQTGYYQKDSGDWEIQVKDQQICDPYNITFNMIDHFWYLRGNKTNRLSVYMSSVYAQKWIDSAQKQKSEINIYSRISGDKNSLMEMLKKSVVEGLKRPIQLPKNR